MNWVKALSFLLAVALCAPPASARDVIRLATQNLPPYHWLVNNQIDGIAFERVRCAMDKIEEPYEIIMMDWSQAQLLTKNGEIEGFFAGSPNAARARYATPSDPVITESLAWYMLPGRQIDPFSEGDKLAARYSAKFATSKWLKLKRSGYNVIKKPNDAKVLLDMLLKGDIDVALEYELIFNHYLEESGLKESDLVKVSDKKQSNMVHFSNTFLSSMPDFLPRFNRYLAQCKGDEK